MKHGRTPHRNTPGTVRIVALALGLLAVASLTATAETNSGRYKFEGNTWLSLDLAVGDVRADTIRFDWPATVMRVKTGYKATVKLANASSRQVGIALAIAVYDADKKLIGAGTTSTTLGTIDPGTNAQFNVEFKDVTARLEQASQFEIALETR